MYLNFLCSFNVFDDEHSHNEERSVIRGDNIHDDCMCVLDKRDCCDSYGEQNNPSHSDLRHRKFVLHIDVQV